jgi:hypothetical protein
MQGTQTEVVVSAGWLSPDGTLYACSYCGHSETARTLVNEHYDAEFVALLKKNTWSPWEPILIKHGWVRIGGGGKITDYEWNPIEHMTQAQIDRAWDMLMAAQEQVQAHRDDPYFTFCGGGYSGAEFVRNLSESLQRLKEE